MRLHTHGRADVRRRLLLAGAALCLAAVGVLHAADGAGSNSAGTNALPGHVCRPASVGPLVIATNGASVPVLPLWVEVPTNAAPSDWSNHVGRTNAEPWLSADCTGMMATSSPWRTTATLETGFFHANHAGYLYGPGYDRRRVDGWYEQAGVEWSRDLEPGASGISVGLGVGVLGTNLRGP